MDPQGLLNMGDREETSHPEGVDHTKSGDAHAAEHDISLTDNGSDAGSGSGQDGSKPDGSGHDDSGENRIGKDSESMDTTVPNFRIVDILPPASLMTIQPLQPVGAGTDPNPLQTMNAVTGTDGSDPAAVTPASMEKHIFAIPSNVCGIKNQPTKSNPVQGKIIFENPSSGTGLVNNPAQSCETSTEYSQNFNTGGTEVPTGSKPAKTNASLPPKRPDPVEPDAVPSKIYDAILTNKKRKEKAGTIGGIASGQGPTECGSFFNKGDNRVLRSVYREDVNSLSISSLSFNPVTWKCSSCPSNHSVLDAKGGRCVIILCDQNFPAVLPSAENRCLSIIRLEHGSLEDLIDLFLKISRPVTVPEGTVVLYGSLTTLGRVGTQSYASACINGKRRIQGAIKGSVAIPFIPPPWEGVMIRNFSGIWLTLVSG
jgi:hypothetical protein